MAQDYKSQLKGNNGVMFRSHWTGLPSKSENCVRVFVMDSLGHFTLHDNDTRHVKEVLNIDNVVKRGSSDVNTTSMEWTMVNLVQLRTLLKELVVVQGYRVEVYEKGDEKGQWDANYGSPGNLTCVEYFVFDPSGDSYIPSCKVLALKILKTGDSNEFALAIVDAESREVQIAVLSDDVKFSQLESILVQAQVKEILLYQPAKDRLTEAAIRCSTLLTKVTKETFAVPTADDLKLLFAKGSTIEGEEELRCFQAAVSYLNLSGSCQFKTATLNMAMTMRLDSSLFENLHLCSTKEKSLFTIISRGCATPHGIRKIRQWITQPLMDLPKILERQAAVEIFIENGEARQNLTSVTLKGLPDVTRIAFKLKTLEKAESFSTKNILRSFSKVNDLCQRLPKIISILQEQESPALECILQPLMIVDAKIQKLIRLFDTHIEVGRCVRIKRGINEDLDLVLDEVEVILEQMDDLAAEAAEELGIPRKDIRLDETNDGQVFRVLNRYDKVLTASKAYDRISTTKAAITFTNGTLQQLSDDWISKQESVDQLSKEIVAQMIKVVLGYTKYLVQVGDVTATLDALLSLSHAALSSSEPWTKPTFVNDKTIDIDDLRHPILESQMVDVVANDVKLASDRRLMILTGPNMGGKSTYLRSVGLCCLLAQMGSYVPAASAQLPVVDSIIARIGAGDNLQRGVSTFLHEMIETETIFRSATESSLVLIDELGRGTSTWDGFGLAYAIAKSVATDIKCFGVFATHYHEMASLETRCEGAFNMHTSVFVQDQKVTHLYKVSPGPCAQSYGIEIAKLAGFRSDVLDRAAELNAEKENVEKVLSSELDSKSWSAAVDVLKEVLEKAAAGEEQEKIVEFAKGKNASLINAVLS